MYKSDFKKGQTVYLKIISGSNASRYINNKEKIDNWIKEQVVTSVGTKYITVNNDVKFDIQNDFNHVYTYGGQDYELYLSKEAIIEDLESEKLYTIIRQNFSAYENNRKLTLEQLKLISSILENAQIDKGYLSDWYQSSIDETIPPVWTDEHLDELGRDFILIPKRNK